MFSTHEIIDIAIRIEKNGESIYREASQLATNADLESTLKWMADEELKHADWFAKLKEDDETWDEQSIAREMSRQLLDSLLSEQGFSLNDIDFSEITAVNRLISIFIEFEKDTILFYEILAPFIQDGETKKKLADIITEENRHVDQLRGLLDEQPFVQKK